MALSFYGNHNPLRSCRRSPLPKSSSFRYRSTCTLCVVFEHTKKIVNNVLLGVDLQKHSRCFSLLFTFRYERPQRGRHRPFRKLRVKNFVSAALEQLAVLSCFIAFMCIENAQINYTIEVNNVGSKSQRKAFFKYCNAPYC